MKEVNYISLMNKTREELSYLKGIREHQNEYMTNIVNHLTQAQTNMSYLDRKIDELTKKLHVYEQRHKDEQNFAELFDEKRGQCCDR